MRKVIKYFKKGGVKETYSEEDEKKYFAHQKFYSNGNRMLLITYDRLGFIKETFLYDMSGKRIYPALKKS